MDFYDFHNLRDSHMKLQDFHDLKNKLCGVIGLHDFHDALFEFYNFLDLRYYNFEF